MQKFRPVQSPADEEWNTKYQIVVPSCYRRKILSLAHDFVGGHMGIRKTYYRMFQHFFWPGLRKNVSEYCRTCHVCQMSGKPNQVIKPVPLKPIPAVHEPFKKIIIDCVGPLPRTKKGN